MTNKNSEDVAESEDVADSVASHTSAIDPTKFGEGDAELLRNVHCVWLMPKRTDNEPQKCRCPQRNETAQMRSPDARMMVNALGIIAREVEERKKDSTSQ